MIDSCKYNVLTKILENVLRKTLGQKLVSVRGNEYGPIFSPQHHIELLLELIRKEEIKHDARILDLGSSIGPVLLYLATEGFNNLAGVDKDPESIDFLSSMEGMIEGIAKDLKMFDIELKTIIEAADIVYLYKPICDRVLYKEVLQNVVAAMSEGSIIVDYSTLDLLREVSKNKLKEVPETSESRTSSYFVKLKN